MAFGWYLHFLPSHPFPVHTFSPLSVCLSFAPLWLSSFPLSAPSSNSSAQHLKEPPLPSPRVHPRFHTKDIVSIMLVTVGQACRCHHACLAHVFSVPRGCNGYASFLMAKFQATSCYPLCVVVCVWMHAKEVIPEPPDGTVSWSCHWHESLQCRCPGKHWRGSSLLREREGRGRNWHLLTIMY